MQNENNKKKVVVMGGGTGIYPVVTALKHLDVELSSIIAVSDSGGSTGRIRDEFGFQPVGDLRQSLAALAEDEGQAWIRKILLYRFTKGNGLKGHNLGNIILTALQDMTGDTGEALKIAQKIFRIEGQVIPVTTENVDLQITYSDGEKLIGEHVLDDDGLATNRTITQVALVPEATINPEAANAIKDADAIIIGPGDLYASLVATLSAKDTALAFAESKATVVYILNLMTRFTQTRDMTAADHVATIEKAIGKKIDIILINSEPIPQPILEKYAESKEHPLKNDLTNDPRVVSASLITESVFEKGYTDNTHRSLLRHSSDKLRIVLDQLLSR